MLRDTTGASPAPEPFERSHLPATPGQDEPVTLVSISEIAGANLLAGGQTLHFEPKGLTVIYGDNGAGKSGYARILKRACRARHAGKIEPNAYADADAVTRATATISFSSGQANEPDLKWQDSDSPHPMLSAISVFDSASVHITEKNEVAFRPFGVHIPDELSTVCQSVEDALSSRTTSSRWQPGHAPRGSPPGCFRHAEPSAHDQNGLAIGVQLAALPNGQCS